MSEKPTVEMIESELQDAREAFKGRRESTVTGAKVKSIRYYHNSKTRHNGAIFILENGKKAYKEYRETDFLNLVMAFGAAKDITVWHDEAGVVQQFVLNQDF